MTPNGKRFSFIIILLISLSSLSCKGWGEYSPGFRHLTKFNSQDSISKYDIEIFARIPDSFEQEDLPIILTIERPDGTRYADTLSLPVRMDMIPYQGLRTGRWTDMKWGYRTGVKLEQAGSWRFYINNNLSYTEIGCSGAMGVIITKL